MLLDECVDRRLAKHLVGHEVTTVFQLGWAGCKDKDLLTRASGQFDALITADRNLQFQQNLPLLDIAVLVVHARSKRLADLQLLVPDILAALPAAQRGKATHVGNP